MDGDMIDLKSMLITEWPDLDFFRLVNLVCQKTGSKREDIYICGSRVFSGFTEQSDIDVSVRGPWPKERIGVFHFEGMKVGINFSMEPEGKWGPYTLTKIRAVDRSIIKGNPDHEARMNEISRKNKEGGQEQ